ncbi:Uncharacterized iron-regulated protein [Marinobacter persicus]|uniref:Uncharacterized iron-regulated protein n=1 Tax=Marinobacter persicus TaxID=930118 RepID=A0A1I3QZN9_9GAMM|nr:ChaN family lipoprotein [Marinobacter persicus]GHD43202.1 hypothetical protein GCM10008110_06780 [Marinobacter persicus]SFJ38536.1 Uncharacterized iron-regulated protein [Marinobacter persicus]
MKTLILALGFATLASGCAASHSARMAHEPMERPASQYDARLVDPATGQALSVQALATRLADTDIVIIGEHHGHHASHLLQARLQQALWRLNPRQVLTMEQFNLDHQPALDDYLAGHTGETEMREDANAWDNYRASYRPLVEFAKQHSLPVIAANAPANTVRCIGRLGPDYLERLDADERRQLPDAPFLDTPAYKDKFVEAIGGSHGTKDDELSGLMLNTYKAQLLRDNTMAARILEARERHPDHQVIHLTGTFHSEDRLGTVAVLEKRAPDLTIAVISPVNWPADADSPPLEKHRERGDYLYFIQPLPQEFRDDERRREAMTERFSRSPEASCD